MKRLICVFALCALCGAAAAKAPLKGAGAKTSATKSSVTQSPKLAPSLEVLGLAIGGDFSLSECPTKANYPGSSWIDYISPYELGSAAPCYEADFGRPSNKFVLNTSDSSVKVVTGEMPAGFDRDGTDVTLIDGKIEGVSLTTVGLNVQDKVFETLVEKYGEPTKIERSTAQNRMGAEFPQIEAEWKFSNLYVLFDGLGSTIENGFVIIQSPIAQARAEQKHQAQKAAAPKL